MKRLLIVAILLITVLVAAIARKLQSQQADLALPPGGSGVIEGTTVNLATQLSTRIEELTVKKGQSVKQGELLVSVDCADVLGSVAEAEARVAMAEAQQAGARANQEAAWRSRGVAQAQADAARIRTEALQTRLAIAERNLVRVVNAGDGVSAATVDQSQAETTSLALEQRAAVDTARATAAQTNVATAQGNAAQANQTAARAALELARATLSRTLLLRRECEIRAPRDGVVEEVFVEPGEMATRGAALVRLVDLDQVKITFYLPNAELSAVRQGGAVTVTADAYPKEHFAGTVTSVSMEAAFTPRNIQTRTDRDRLVYPVEVTLTNPGRKLRPGMPADVRLATH